MQETRKLFEKSTLKTRKMHPKDFYKIRFSYRWPDFRGILSQILGGILSQILTHFARLKILFWFGWLFFGSESSRRDILASFIWTRLVRDIITFNSSRKSRDQSAKSEQQYRVSLRLASYAALTWAASRTWVLGARFWSGFGETRLTARVLIGGLRVLPIENHLAKLC